MPRHDPLGTGPKLLTRGTFSLPDAILLLNYLYMSGTGPGCEDAADANDDGVIGLVDAISILLAQFGSPPSPLPPPYLVCGGDPTPDSLSCLGFAGCP